MTQTFLHHRGDTRSGGSREHSHNCGTLGPRLLVIYFSSLTRDGRLSSISVIWLPIFGLENLYLHSIFLESLGIFLRHLSPFQYIRCYLVVS